MNGHEMVIYGCGFSGVCAENEWPWDAHVLYSCGGFFGACVCRKLIVMRHSFIVMGCFFFCFFNIEKWGWQVQCLQSSVLFCWLLLLQLVKTVVGNAFNYKLIVTVMSPRSFFLILCKIKYDYVDTSFSCCQFVHWFCFHLNYILVIFFLVLLIKWVQIYFSDYICFVHCIINLFVMLLTRVEIKQRHSYFSD